MSDASRPRILVLSLAYFPFVGGAEVAIQEIINYLPQYEFEILSADLSRGRWAKYFFPIFGYREACRRHQAKPYDLVWGMMANQAGMAAALFKRRFPEVPFVLTLQEGDELESWPYRLRLIGPRLFGVFKRPDRVQAISHYLAKWGRKMGIVAPIEVIPNGVDLRKFVYQPRIPSMKAGPLIVTTSRLVPKNGLSDLISSLCYLPAQIKLLIVGSGPLEAKLKRQAEFDGLAGRVSFAGAVSPEQIPLYLKDADVFVRPSLSEGQGISFLEAMAAGLPVVATPVGGIPDFLEDGRTGWLCPPRNPKSLAQTIQKIVDSDEAAKVSQVIDAARQRVIKDYDWEVISQKFSSFIVGLL